MSVDWQHYPAAIWRGRRGVLRPVAHLDPISLGDLLGVDQQKAALVRNTERFLGGQPANNALLWGARGTGKSSLVKAVLNAFKGRGLRAIEIDKHDLIDLPEIVDEVRDLPHHFLVFCDDLSFEPGDQIYKSLKSVLEGSIETPPRNVLIYATSNRRHLMPEKMQDNLDTRIEDGEVHYTDTLEETLSLADRFGLWLSFHPSHWDSFYAMVDHLFANYTGDRAQLHEAARLFTMSRGGAKSGRTARQFYNFYFDKTER